MSSVLDASVLDSNDFLYEIIDGERVELPPMGINAVLIATQLAVFLGWHVRNQNLGQLAVEGLFQLPLPKPRNRRPDIAFVSYRRWPKGKPQSMPDNAWDVVPNLAVEVVSPHDYCDDLMDKMLEYFQAGVELVWTIYPRHQLVHVYESPTTLRALSRSDRLTGGNVVPGFDLPLADLFPEVIE